LCMGQTANPGMQENTRFNRRETASGHLYYGHLGFNGIGEQQYEGLIKVKLAHGSHFSVVVPEVLFLGTEAQQWIQPLAFHPNVIHFLPEGARCRLHVDISCGHTIAVDFSESALVGRLTDGAELYRCTLTGVDNLPAYATGSSKRTEDGRVWLQLFHHTTPEFKNAILTSGHFRLSRWNIQGTKRLINVGYVYFTPLDRIIFDSDLKCVAMAADGEITMLVDGVELPPIDSPVVRKLLKGKLLELQVYRESTANRTAVLPFWVDVAALGPQHIWRHAAGGQPVFYEIASPFIHRVGLPAGSELQFSGDHIPATDSLKRFDYAVIGDARILSGLAAPFDEEDTRHVLKIERPATPSNLFRFWHEHANTDLFGSKEIKLQEFESEP
jgi:hypothetical protein